MWFIYVNITTGKTLPLFTGLQHKSDEQVTSDIAVSHFYSKKRKIKKQLLFHREKVRLQQASWTVFSESHGNAGHTVGPQRRWNPIDTGGWACNVSVDGSQYKCVWDGKDSNKFYPTKLLFSAFLKNVFQHLRVGKASSRKGGPRTKYTKYSGNNNYWEKLNTQWEGGAALPAERAAPTERCSGHCSTRARPAQEGKPRFPETHCQATGLFWGKSAKMSHKKD